MKLRNSVWHASHIDHLASQVATNTLFFFQLGSAVKGDVHQILEGVCESGTCVSTKGDMIYNTKENHNPPSGTGKTAQRFHFDFGESGIPRCYFYYLVLWEGCLDDLF